MKSSCTPKFFHSTVTAADVPVPPWETGTGNCPPARKLACDPFMATRLGSAMMESNEFCRRARIRISKLPLGKMPKAVVLGPVAPVAVLASPPRPSKPDAVIAEPAMLVP